MRPRAAAAPRRWAGLLALGALAPQCARAALCSTDGLPPASVTGTRRSFRELHAAMEALRGRSAAQAARGGFWVANLPPLQAAQLRELAALLHWAGADERAAVCGAVAAFARMDARSPYVVSKAETERALNQEADGICAPLAEAMRLPGPGQREDALFECVCLRRYPLYSTLERTLTYALLVSTDMAAPSTLPPPLPAPPGLTIEALAEMPLAEALRRKPDVVGRLVAEWPPDWQAEWSEWPRPRRLLRRLYESAQDGALSEDEELRASASPVPPSDLPLGEGSGAALEEAGVAVWRAARQGAAALPPAAVANTLRAAQHLAASAESGRADVREGHAREHLLVPSLSMAALHGSGARDAGALVVATRRLLQLVRPVVAPILGEAARIFEVAIFITKPGAPDQEPHRDIRVSPEHREAPPQDNKPQRTSGVTCQLALTPAEKGTGALACGARTHRRLWLIRTGVHDVAVEPGDVLCYIDQVVHYGGAFWRNRTGQRAVLYVSFAAPNMLERMRGSTFAISHAVARSRPLLCSSWLGGPGCAAQEEL
eukprot:TRINITY_DN40090_c0_g1_i1.p1 TRINITY_DN40090_c0_g1~~TRINITY_DN40090_c0_g1_i1.p1  ORF type:complete len:545 (+),score=172.44 TRINITY_DN40090_c0_g1_i1:85-1719(+)